MSDQPPPAPGDPSDYPGYGHVPAPGAEQPPATPPPPGGPPPSPAQRPPPTPAHQPWPQASAPAPAPRRSSGLAATPPAHLVSAVLVVAGGLALVGVLVAMASTAGAALRGGGLFELGFFERVQLGTASLSVPLLLLVPLAIHLACTPGPDGRDPTDEGLPRMVVTVATVLGAAFAFLVTLRLVANLAGEELLIAASGGAGTRAAAFFFDLAALVVVVAATAWGARLLQGPSGGPASAARPAGSTAPGWSPPPSHTGPTPHPGG